MNRIAQLDEQLSNLFEGFNAIANDLNMGVICDLADKSKIEQQKYPGIYRIDISTAGTALGVAEWIETLRGEWEHEDFLKKFTPNFKKKRIAEHKQLTEWMPLYLGKSKTVGKRVLEHINLGLEKSTFALKLNARAGMAKRKFRLSTLELRVKNYDLIAPALESALRNRFHPLVGKQ